MSSATRCWSSRYIRVRHLSRAGWHFCRQDRLVVVRPARNDDGCDKGQPRSLGGCQLTYKRWTLVAAILGSAIVFLDSTVVNVALPRIGRELHSDLFGTLEAQAYVYSGYLLTLSALLILAGALSDFYGRRRMFGIGLAGFGVSSILCGVAPSIEILILARILQGVFGALLVPGSLALITATFEGVEQGRAFGVWAAASAGATILGPLVGSPLGGTISCRPAFLIHVPFAAGAPLVARSRRAPKRGANPP